MATVVKSGLDVLVAQKFAPLKGQKVAVLAHAASVNCNLQHVVDLLHASGVCEVLRIFAPEHGFRGDAQAMVAVDNETDTRTGIPVISLYGSTRESLAPTAESLSGVDTLLVDLQDVGSRYYTYTQTMLYCMYEAGKSGVKVLVLDRPNPLGGKAIEGSLLQNSCRSFCGELSLANRHGLTIGEYAQLANQGFTYGDNTIPATNCSLEVIPLEGWKREFYFDATSLPWVMPSPNMPTLDTAIVYPGACLFEACNISEARGTTRPFELIGAPYINSVKWAEATFSQGIELTGAKLRPTYFTPRFNKWSGKTCEALQIHVTDRDTFQSYRWSLALIAAAAELFPKDFAWIDDAYEFITNVPAIDLLFGSSKFRVAVENKRGLKDIEVELKAFEGDYLNDRKVFLAY